MLIIGITSDGATLGPPSEVKAGENRGRRLNHDFAVRELIDKPMTDDGDASQCEFVLSSHRKLETGRLAIAVWVTRSGRLDPLQAAGGWLPPSQEK